LTSIGVLYALMHCEDVTGVPVLSCNRCEPGKGKTSVDTNFAHCKGHADDVGRSGVDQLDAAQFRDALDAEGGAAGNTNLLIEYGRAFQPKIKTACGPTSQVCPTKLCQGVPQE